MELFMNFAQSLVGYVGVNLRGGYAGVAEHALDAANVRAVLQQVGGKRMP